jgi:uncharacterized protein (TIGR03000 family)
MIRQVLFRIGVPAVAVAVLLLAADPSFAQRGGRGGRGGGGGRAVSSGAWRGGSGSWRGGTWNGGNWNGRGFYPYGIAIGLGYGGWGGYGGGYYGGGGYYYPSYDNYYDYGYAPDYYGYSQAPSGYQSFYPPASTNGEQPALINVWAPPGATIAIDGVEQTASNQAYRQFQSQPLTPGYKYSYSITAHWNENGQAVEKTRKVSFKAGEQANVNFMPGS